MNRTEKLGLLIICTITPKMQLTDITWYDFIILFGFIAGAALFVEGGDA